MRNVSLMTLLVSVMLMVAATPSWAAGDWIVSAHGGQTDVDRLIRSDAEWWNRVDDDSSSFGISAGYDFIPELGVRLAYERATGLTGTNRCPAGQVCPELVIRDDFDADLWSLTVVPRWYVTGNWSVFATAGVTHWDIGSGTELPGGNGTEAALGLGTSWLATPELELGLEFQRSDMDHETWRLNVGWRFGAW